MPHLRFRGLSEDSVKELSLTLPKELSEILKTPEDNFTIEKVETIYFRLGKSVSESDLDPMVEFLWFDRGPEVRTAAAKKVTELLKLRSKSEFISVVFVDLPKEHYYENGVSF